MQFVEIVSFVLCKCIEEFCDRLDDLYELFGGYLHRNVAHFTNKNEGAEVKE